MGNANKPEDPAAAGWPENPSGSTPPHRVWNRRRYRVAATVGLAAVLGTGAFVTVRMVQGQSVAVSGANPGPMNAPSPIPASEATSSRAATRGATTPGATTSATTKPSVKSSATARGAHGLPPPPAGKVAVDPAAVMLTSSGSLPKDRHTLHVWSARADLSAQREMTLAGDAGHPVGKARCTQKFRFTADSDPVEKPTALLCWRITPTKSVYLLAVDLDHRPSKKAAAAKINKVWKKLG
jgi:hypothetical protein